MDKVDRVFVLSLESAHARREKFAAKNPDLVALPQFEFFIVNKAPGISSVESIFENHKSIARLAAARGYSLVMIMEDDAELTVSWSQFTRYMDALAAATGGFQKPSDWEYILLGYLPIRTARTDVEELVHVNCAFDAHMYLVNVARARDIPFNRACGSAKCSQFDFVYFCNSKSVDDIVMDLNPGGSTGHVYAANLNLAVQGWNPDQVSMDQSSFFRFYWSNRAAVDVSTRMNTVSFGILVLFLSFFLVLTAALLVAAGATRDSAGPETSTGLKWATLAAAFASLVTLTVMAAALAAGARFVRVL